jgi:hypothetical protein
VGAQKKNVKEDEGVSDQRSATFKVKFKSVMLIPTVFIFPASIANLNMANLNSIHTLDEFHACLQHSNHYFEWAEYNSM